MKSEKVKSVLKGGWVFWEFVIVPGNGNRVLPFKYLSRLLDALSLKAIIVRPSLDGWNSISQTHTLEQMLIEIGEPVYRWHRKEKEK